MQSSTCSTSVIQWRISPLRSLFFCSLLGILEPFKTTMNLEFNLSLTLLMLSLWNLGRGDYLGWYTTQVKSGEQEKSKAYYQDIWMFIILLLILHSNRLVLYQNRLIFSDQFSYSQLFHPRKERMSERERDRKGKRLKNRRKKERERSLKKYWNHSFLAKNELQ